jgi:hypothetical protein
MDNRPASFQLSGSSLCHTLPGNEPFHPDLDDPCRMTILINFANCV